MTISPDKFYTLSDAARILRVDRRGLLYKAKKYLLVAGETKQGTRYFIKGKHLLLFVKKM